MKDNKITNTDQKVNKEVFDKNFDEIDWGGGRGVPLPYAGGSTCTIVHDFIVGCRKGTQYEDIILSNGDELKIEEDK